MRIRHYLIAFIKYKPINTLVSLLSGTAEFLLLLKGKGGALHTPDDNLNRFNYEFSQLRKYKYLILVLKRF